MTLHVFAYLSLELLFGTHTFHFNCFLRILIAYLRKYAAYLGCCHYQTASDLGVHCLFRYISVPIFGVNTESYFAASVTNTIKY